MALLQLARSGLSPLSGCMTAMGRSCPNAAAARFDAKGVKPAVAVESKMLRLAYDADITLKQKRASACRAPVDLGAASPNKREALTRAFAKAKDARTAGSWRFIFRLVVATTMTTAAIRSIPLPKKTRKEPASLLLKSLDNPRDTPAPKAVPLQEAFLTDHDPFEALHISERIA